MSGWCLEMTGNQSVLRLYPVDGGGAAWGSGGRGRSMTGCGSGSLRCCRWSSVEQRYPGRKRLEGRRVLGGILFLLYTGIPWEFLPRELGYGSGSTCRRRLRDWRQAGVWQALHELLLAELRAADLLDFSRAAVDGSRLRAMKGGAKTGP